MTNKRTESIAIGITAGYSLQGTEAIAIGIEAGYTAQQSGALAIGYRAGYGSQGAYTTAIGYQSGITGQRTGAIAIGYESGYTNMGTNSIAIGYQAGYANKGSGSIAIGYLAGKTGQVVNSIIINATGVDLSDSGITGLFMAPIRIGDTSGNLLMYNTGANEVVVSSDLSDFTKTFVIDHPIHKDKYLVHACLEGPETGVYYRGKGTIQNNIMTTINLPEYVSKIATDFTIHISPIYDPTNDTEQLYNVSDVVNNSFNVYGSNGSFFWIVYGKRCDIDVEPNKKDVIVNGDGPYKWISSK